MAGYKETPRQKMIALMYLVLTALLALNVSKDVLNAFVVVNESLDDTNTGLDSKIDYFYRKFDQQYKLNPAKVGPKWKESKEVQNRTDNLLKYLNDLKFKLVMVSEMKDSAKVRELYYKDTVLNGKHVQYLMLDKVPTRDKYDNTTNYLINNREAYRLADSLKSYRKFILAKMHEPEDSKTIGLIIKEGKAYHDATGTPEDWEYHYFNHTILAADIALINNFVNEVQSAEFDAINYLYSSITASDYKFDNVVAKVIPKRTYVLKGRKYEAEVLVAAYDTKTKPDVYVMPGVDTWKPEYLKKAQKVTGESGIVKLEFPATKEGVHKYAGVIELLDPKTNKKVQYPFSGKYMVAPPALIVSPLKMNVFYIGVKNPVAISVPGIPTEKIKPSISKGKLYRDPENKSQWIVEVPKGVKKTYISAITELDGKPYDLGKSEFRVKRVPDPIATIAGITGGQVGKNQLLAAGAIIPELKGFEFDLYFKIISFSMSTIINGDFVTLKTKGNRFSRDMRRRIKGATRKQKFLFERILAVGPDGSKRTLNPVNIEIK